MRKLTDEDYEEIRQMYVDGVSKADICRKKGVSKYYVDNIIYGIKGCIAFFIIYRLGV